MSQDAAKALEAKAALDKIQEGLAEFITAAADEGEPEILQNAFLLLETRGMADYGQFSRTDYLVLEQSGLRTQMIGMWEMLKERIDHDLRCGGDHGE